MSILGFLSHPRPAEPGELLSAEVGNTVTRARIIQGITDMYDGNAAMFLPGFGEDPTATAVLAIEFARQNPNYVTAVVGQQHVNWSLSPAYLSSLRPRMLRETGGLAVLDLASQLHKKFGATAITLTPHSHGMDYSVEAALRNDGNTPLAYINGLAPSGFAWPLANPADISGALCETTRENWHHTSFREHPLQLPFEAIAAFHDLRPALRILATNSDAPEVRIAAFRDDKVFSLLGVPVFGGVKDACHNANQHPDNAEPLARFVMQLCAQPPLVLAA